MVFSSFESLLCREVTTIFAQGDGLPGCRLLLRHCSLEEAGVTGEQAVGAPAPGGESTWLTSVPVVVLGPGSRVLCVVRRRRCALFL